MKVITEINRFPFTETKNFNRMFILSDRKDTLKIKSIRRNPNNRMVYFVTLFKEDLNKLENTFYKTKITKEDMQHNEFAVYNYQLKEIIFTGTKFNHKGITWEVIQVGETACRCKALTESVKGKTDIIDNKIISKF